MRAGVGAARFEGGEGRLEVARTLLDLRQIQERYHATDDAREAVVEGLAATGRVITSAALVMVFVFSSFVLNGDPIVKQFGVGLAAAVFLAATMVLVLALALLVLMGRGTWWLPAWLSRVVPHVDIEGTAIAEAQR